jgi:hypothetical protein
MHSLRNLTKFAIVGNSNKPDISDLPKTLIDELTESKEYCILHPDRLEAIKNDHVDCLMRTNPALSDDVLVKAAKYGSIKTVKHLRSLNFPWNKQVCNYAVEYGYFDILKYAVENGCPLDAYVCVKAIRHDDHLDCFKYLIEKGCPLDEDVTDAAVEYGKIDFLKYAVENGCPLAEDACCNAAHYGYLDCLTYVHENGALLGITACINAVIHGHLDCLKYLHVNGCRWDETVCVEAVRYGHLDCLKYLHVNGCPWNENVTFMAAATNNIDCLRYALENGCSWKEIVCVSAVMRGYLDCLKYLHENGCIFGEDVPVGRLKEAPKGGYLKYTIGNGWMDAVLVYAAAYGHLNCLKYLHENGCKFTKKVFDQVSVIWKPTDMPDIKARQLDCLKYAVEKGCPCTRQVYIRAIDLDRPRFAKYIRQNMAE